LALPQRNTELLDSLFWEVSNPDSPKYQEFMTVDQINALVATDPAIVHAVANHLKSYGIENIKYYSDALIVMTTVKIGSALFSSKFYEYSHARTGKKIVRVHGDIHIPDVIAPHIELIEGIQTWPVEHLGEARRMKKKSKSTNAGNPATDMITPQFILNYYNMPNVTVTGLPAPVSQGVIQWQGQYYDEADVKAYTGNLSLPYSPLTANHVIGTNDPTNPGEESQMDIELITGMNPRATNWFWENAGTSWIYTFALTFSNTQKVPMLISMSYGLDEQQTCANANCTNIVVYFKRSNIEFSKIGLRGVSVFSASGDSGANGRSDGFCTQPYLNALYPAASPYVTAVGATEPMNPTYGGLTTPPTACAPSGGTTWTCVTGGGQAAVSTTYSQYASGGGFSNYSVQPSFQIDAVNKYFQTGVTMPPRSYYHRHGKAIPDVSAWGIDGCEVMNGALNNGGDGTSMATPTFSGVMSILNSWSVKLSGKPLGFVSPLLYKMWGDNPATFNDVTVGNNICTEDGCSAGCQGWQAAPGWDPVTGLGTPNFGNMLTYLQNMHAQKKLAKKVKKHL